MVPVISDDFILMLQKTGTAAATAEKLVPALAQNLSLGILPFLLTLYPWN